MRAARTILSFLIAFVVFVPTRGLAQKVVRAGSFANLTHEQALVGKAKGWFDQALGSDVKIQWTTFNAGPSAIEALFAGAIALTHVGPNPPLTGYICSHGHAQHDTAGPTVCVAA